jgi:hypothetical protein
LFVGHRLVEGDPRTILITDGVRADTARRFADHNGRPPSPAELEKAMLDWKHEEALYREALRLGLDREDRTVRTVLADKMRARAAFAIPRREPTEAELSAFFSENKKSYERPVRYACEFFAWPKTEAAADKQIENFERDLLAGKNPKTLGRPLFGVTLNMEDLGRRFGPDAAKTIAGLPLGRWQRVENEASVHLVRVNRTEGGMPSREELKARLVADFKYAVEQRAIARAVEAIAGGYRFEEEP